MKAERHRIEGALAQLIGLPLWATHRAMDMQTFQLGEKRVDQRKFGARKGELVTRGAFAIHVQCAWRITGPAGVLVGSRDLYEKCSEQKDVPDDQWDWATPGATLRDERLKAWLASSTYAVNAVMVGACGDVCVQLADGYRLDVFADVSGDRECWRLLCDGPVREHFVMLGEGVEA